MTEQSNAEKRRAATTHAAAGGGMIAAGTAGSMAADRYLTRKGLKGPVKTLAEGGPRKIRGNAKRLKGSHLKFMGMKAASRPLTAVGIPMAAYGAYNLARPHKEQVKRVSVRDDVAKPIARAAVLADHRMSKSSGLSQEERTKLIRRKRVGRDLSLVGGTLGLGALALRAPAGAKLASRSTRLSKVPGLSRLASKGEQATRLSNTTGIAAIGSGSVGSFNYASQQRLESKAEKAKIRKGKLPTWKWINGERVRITGIHQPSGRLMGTNSRDETVFASPARKGPRKAPPAAPPNAAYLKAKDDLTKADPFLRQYGQNISTGAEDGYRYLKGVRNDSAKRSAAGAGVTAGSAALLGKLGRKATRTRLTRGSAVGALVAGTAGAGYATVQGRKAKRMQGHMNKIKAKGIERAATGELGRDRGPMSKATKAPTAAEYRKYLTRGEINSNRAQVLGLYPGMIAAQVGGGYAAYRGAQQVQRGFGQRRVEQRVRPSGRPELRSGPREVKPNRRGVYDVRGKEPKKVPPVSRAVLRRGAGKVGGGLGLSIAGTVAYGVNNVRLARAAQKKTIARRDADLSKAALLREDYARALSVDSDLSKALGGLRLGRAVASTVPRIGQGTISTKPRVAGLRRLGSGRLISVKGSTR